jgi:hypothetical protein
VSEPSVIYRDEGNYLVVWDRVVIQVRTGALTLAALDVIEPAVHLARARLKLPVGALGILEPTAELPPPEVRKRQRAFFEAMLDTKGTFGALVVLGDGVEAFARRAVFRTLRFGRPGMRVFDDIATGAAWLGERIGIEASALEEVAAAARKVASTR